MGRGASDDYRRVPEDAPGPRWSMHTDLGEESAESGSPKLEIGLAGVHGRRGTSLTGVVTPSSR